MASPAFQSVEPLSGPAPAVRFEDRLLELAASAGPLRRVLAAIAGRVAAGRAHERLAYARLCDYARERAGVSARQLRELARVDRALTELPALEWALLANELPWSKVRLIARVATREDEEAWIARAREAPVRRLEREVRAHAREPDCDEPLLPGSDEAEATAQIRLRCAPAVRERWSLVREVSQRVAGERLSDEETLEWMLAEVASALPVEPERFSGWDEPVTRRTDAWLDPDSPESRGAGRGPARRAPARTLPKDVRALAEGLDAADAFELDRRLRAAVRLEQTLDAQMAPLLRVVTCAEFEWRDDWCRLATLACEHLGMSPGKARSLVRVERAGDACRELRAAYRRGRISWVKARILIPLLVLDVDGDGWRDVWVAWAERVTVRRLERDVKRALLLRAGHHFAWQRCKRDPARAWDPIPQDERQMCADEIDFDATEELRFRVALPVAALFRAVRSRVSFEHMLDHALSTWLLQDPGARRPDPVVVRDGWRCAVPGCTSRRNLQDHHIEFRSHGGSDDPANRITVCAFHHHRGVHAGRLRIRGTAPDGLVFELGVRESAPPLVRYRSGDMEIV